MKSGALAVSAGAGIILGSHGSFTRVGELLTGRDYGGDAKKCVDAVVMMIDARRTMPVFFKFPASMQTEADVRLRYGC